MFCVRPLAEGDILEAIEAMGGTLAHADAHRRDKRGADFLLGKAVIELKTLDEDGLQKESRQRKIATIFEDEGNTAPVVVLDTNNLSESGQVRYDRALEGPIKGAITSARKQLQQTRSERPDAKLSILWLINNGYTALNHDELAALAARRARNDTSSIDGIIVSGCYYHSDGFDSYFLWPIDYIPLQIRSFPDFAKIRASWNDFAGRFMTGVVQGTHETACNKYPVVDSQFEVNGRMFVKPAPPMGGQSKFYRSGRPRKNSSGITQCPPVALTFPGLTKIEWQKFRASMPHELELWETYSDWIEHENNARHEGNSLKPLVRTPFTFDEWQAWFAETGRTNAHMVDVYEFASVRFQANIKEILDRASELKQNCFQPSRYILVATDEIGQDRANDLSHIAKVTSSSDAERRIAPILEDQRIFHEYAIALAGAYALKEGFEQVMWIRRLKYAWR